MPQPVDEHLLLLLRSYINRPVQLIEALRFASPQDLAQQLGAKERENHVRCVEQDLRWLEKPSHHLVVIDDPDYPVPLLDIDDPPPALWLDGDREKINELKVSVAIVGSRKASQYGRHRALEIASQLASHRIAVTSGLALGIDAAAHEGALEVDGMTCAVMATGCDDIYPKRHWRLADRIRENGLLITEFPTGTRAYPSHFPRRNRIVTGLSQAVVVVEAALRSGSLVSARLALSQGREVMAVPGLVTQINSRGCHQLIRDGAALVESAEDVMRELGLQIDTCLNVGLDAGALTAAERDLLATLHKNPASIDELVNTLDHPLDEITVNLVSLEVLGLIYSDFGIYHAAGVEA